MRIHPRIARAAAAFALFFTGVPAAAETPVKPRALRWDPALDAAVTLGGATAWIVSQVLKGRLAPSNCRWCDGNSVDTGVRDALVWRDTGAADTISDLTAFVMMPLVSGGLDALAAAHDGAPGDAPEDALLIAEATVLAADVDHMAKLLAGRERPFVHALSPQEKRLTAQPSDNNLSFFSGHATEAFALAAGSATIGTMRGYRWAPAEWSLGFALAATTGYLRIAADRHWLTDVLVGMVVGTAIGVAVPLFFHSPGDEPARASASALLRAPALQKTAALTLAW